MPLAIAGRAAPRPTARARADSLEATCLRGTSFALSRSCREARAKLDSSDSDDDLLFLVLKVKVLEFVISRKVQHEILGKVPLWT